MGFEQSKTFHEVGGDKFVVASGGAIDIRAGGDIDVLTSGLVTIRHDGLIDLLSGAHLHVESGSVIDGRAGGAIIFSSGSTIEIRAGASLDVQVGALTNQISRSEFHVVTLDEINADHQIVNSFAGQTINVTDMTIRVTGNFTGAATLHIEDTAGTVNIWSVTAGAMGDSALLDIKTANVTPGAGYLGPLTQGEGIRVVATGTFGGGTSITIAIEYRTNR